MHLFLIASVPIAFVYALILRGEAGEPPSLIGASALRGLLAYLVELVVLLLLRRFLPRVHSGIAAYFFSVLCDFGIPVLLTFLLYLWFTPRVRGLSAKERQLSLMSFMTGAFTLAGIMDLFLQAEYFGVYELFLLPGLRVAAILVVPLIYRLFVQETFWVRWLYIAAIVAIPFVFALVYYLVILNFMLAAILTAAGLFVGGWLLTFFQGRSAASRGR